MKRTILKIYLLVTLLEAILFSGIIFSRSAGSDFFLNFGFTLKYFFLSGGVGVIFLALTFFLLLNWREGVTEQVVNWLNRKDTYLLSVLFFSGLLVESGQDILFLYSGIKPPLYQRYLILLDSLFPLLLWGLVFSVQSLLLIHILRAEKSLAGVKGFRFSGWMIPFLVLSGCWILISITGLGFIPRTGDLLLRKPVGGFEPANAPLPGLYVFLVWAGALAAWWLAKITCKRWLGLKKVFQSHWIVPLLLWAAAFVIWVQVPIEANWSIDVIPGAETRIHPASDAFYYEKEAQKVLAGEGFTDTSSHALYSLFLAALHWIGGAGYADIVPLQIAVLALIPAILWYLGRYLHSGFSGLLLALLYILRERNHLLLADDISGAVPHMLSSENLALLGVVVFLLLIMQWTDAPRKREYYPLLAGAVIGFSILARIELLAVLGLVLVGAAFILWNRKKKFFRGSLMLAAVVVLMLAPWTFRNQARSGRIQLEKSSLLKNRVQDIVSGFPGFEFLSSEPSGYIQESQVSGPKMGGFEVLANHLVSSAELSILYLPSNHQPFLTLGSVLDFDTERGIGLFNQGLFSEDYLERYVRSLPFFWFDWDGTLPTRSILPVMAVLFFISLGLWGSWKRRGMTAILPVVAFFAHLLIYAMVHYSGSRYIKLVDWISLLYLALGLGEFTRWAVSGGKRNGLFSLPLISAFPGEDQRVGERLIPRPVLFSLVIILFGTSLALPLVEAAIPPRYTRERMSAVIRNLPESTGSELSSAAGKELQAALAEGKALYYGKALYPRYFAAGEMLPDDRSGTLPGPYSSRIDFYLVGMENSWVSLPTRDPAWVFPHDVEVIIEGHWTRDTNPDLGKGLKPYLNADRIYILSRPR